jgi:hypothetical protein
LHHAARVVRPLLATGRPVPGSSTRPQPSGVGGPGPAARSHVDRSLPSAYAPSSDHPGPRYDLIVMRLIVWNMGNGGPGASEEKHQRAWQYLEQQEWDVALLQETRRPPEWAASSYASRVWRPKYARNPKGKGLWGCAVIGRSRELEEYEPDEAFPWLEELKGSTAIARSPANRRWSRERPFPRLQDRR